MVSKSISVTAAFWLILSSVGLSGQAAMTQEGDVVRSLKLFAWQSTIRDLYLLTSSGPESVMIPNGAPSLEINYTGGNTAYFGRMVPGEEGELIFQPVSQVDLPQTRDPVLLVFFPVEKGAYRIIPFVDDGDLFTPGAMRLINMSRTPLMVRLGDKDVALAPGSHETVSAVTQESRNITVLMAAHENGQWERAYSARWGVLPERRVTVFISRDADSGRIAMRRIVER